MLMLLWVVGGILLVEFRINILFPEGDGGLVVYALVALSTLILSWRINRSMERRWEEEKAEADRKDYAERERERELERNYYRENPERLVTEFCPECNMEIPAFARICPYCRSHLR